jgi:Microtubule binding
LISKNNRWIQNIRSRRIAEARRNGKLLLECNSSDCNELIDSTAVDTSLKSDNQISTGAGSSVPTDAEAKIDDDLIKKMSQEVSRLAQYQIEAKQERRNSDAHLLQKVQEMISKETVAASSAQSLSVLQSTTKVLEQTNVQLMEELKQLNHKLVHETESHTVQTAQLQMKLLQSQVTIGTLEELQSDLKHQLATLISERDSEQKSKEDMREQLLATTNELEEVEKRLDEIKENMIRESNDAMDEIHLLQDSNDALQATIEKEKQSFEQLQKKLQAKDEAIQRLESDVIPNLQITIETERDTVARLEQTMETRQHDMDRALEQITKLQNDIQLLHDQYEELQRNSLQAEQDHRKIEEELQQSNSNEEKLSSAHEDIKHELQALIETNCTLQKSNETFILQQKELNDALEDSMMQLDNVEKEKRVVEQQLQQALLQIETIQNSLSLTNAEMSEKLQQMTEQLHTERQVHKDAEKVRIELQTMMSNQQSEIVALQQTVEVTKKERDVARNNMDGYSVREQKLYDQLQYYETVRREMHSKLMQLMGNIRVFVRIRPRLSNEGRQTQQRVDPPKSKKRMSLMENIKAKRNEMELDDTEEDIFRFLGMYEGENSSPTDDNHKKLAATMTSTMPGTTSISSSDDITKNMIEVTAPYKDRGGLNDRRKQWTFGFDRVFTPNNSQQDIWDATDPLIQCAVDGYHVTIFAYGQTGSGVRGEIFFHYTYSYMFEKKVFLTC